MEALYVGPYRQNDEWGNTSKALLSLLSSQKEIDLVARPVWFNNENNFEKNELFEELERKKVQVPDVLIQHGLPSSLNYNGKFKKNIAVTSVDCRVDNTSWPANLNFFDDVLVFSKHEKELLETSGVTSNIFAFDFSPIHIPEKIQDMNLNLRGKKFYTISSLEPKSGLRETLAAYLSSFTILDNCILIVACKDSKAVEGEIASIKKGLGKFDEVRHYPEIAVINSLEPALINHIHQYADYYIDSSYNSRIGQELLKSIAFGSIPIMLDICEPLIWNHEYLINSSEEICFYPQRPLHGLYSGEFSWSIPSMKSIAENMRKIYQSSEEQLEMTKQKVAKCKSQLITLPNKWIKELLCIQ